jgi:hypothetical protein
MSYCLKPVLLLLWGFSAFVSLLCFLPPTSLQSHHGVSLLSQLNAILITVMGAPSISTSWIPVKLYTTSAKPVCRSRRRVTSRWLKHFVMSRFLYVRSCVCLYMGEKDVIFKHHAGKCSDTVITYVILQKFQEITPRTLFSLGPILPTMLVTGYGATTGTLWTILPTVLILCPVICSYLIP